MKKVLFLLLIVLAVVFGALYYFTKDGSLSNLVPETNPSVEPPSAPGTPGTTASIPAGAAPDVPPTMVRPKSRGDSRDAWEAEISDALADPEISNEDAIRKLLSLSYDPAVDAEVRGEALDHALNLTDDEDFRQVLPLFTSASTPPEMLDAILTDLYNRGDRVKLESVLAVARVEDHPSREGAMELLTFYIDEEDYGTDWDKWGVAVQKYLEENGE